MSKISLKSSHIYFKIDVIEHIFNNIHYAYAIYNKNLNQILITPVSSQWFVKIYEKPAQFLLKERNLNGDKTLAIREIFIDNELDITDRDLKYEIIKKTKLIKIML